MKTRVFNLLILDENGSMSSIEKQAVAMCGRLNASRERWFSRIADNDTNANEDFFEEK